MILVPRLAVSIGGQVASAASSTICRRRAPQIPPLGAADLLESAGPPPGGWGGRPTPRGTAPLFDSAHSRSSLAARRRGPGGSDGVLDFHRGAKQTGPAPSPSQRRRGDRVEGGGLAGDRRPTPPPPARRPAADRPPPAAGLLASIGGRPAARPAASRAATRGSAQRGPAATRSSSSSRRGGSPSL